VHGHHVKLLAAESRPGCMGPGILALETLENRVTLTCTWQTHVWVGGVAVPGLNVARNLFADDWIPPGRRRGWGRE